MAGGVATLRPTGDYRSSYAADQAIMPTRGSGVAVLALIVVLAVAPLVLNTYLVSLLIQIGYFGIAALGLNILVGFTGQISIGHAAFFGFGAFMSCYFNNNFHLPVFFSIPLAGLATTAIGMIFGVPAARIRGLYLAIATFAAEIILEDFFARAGWFTGGAAGAHAKPFTLLGLDLNTDRTYAYVVLVYVVLMTLYATNLMRSRDGRALVAVRDHYLSAEMMGINLTKYRILSFGISSFFAGVGGALSAHYLGFVSSESITILLSIQFLAMIIIGGLGSILGSWLGTIFMVLLPQGLEWIVHLLGQTGWGNIPAVTNGIVNMKEAAVGLVIILFLIFEPDGLAHRWRLIKASWKLYPFSY
jgi:branched-chain amino acid transport system permease protein